MKKMRKQYNKFMKEETEFIGMVISATLTDDDKVDQVMNQIHNLQGVDEKFLTPKYDDNIRTWIAIDLNKPLPQPKKQAMPKWDEEAHLT